MDDATFDGLVQARIDASVRAFAAALAAGFAEQRRFLEKGVGTSEKARTFAHAEDAVHTAFWLYTGKREKL